jgi:hypothetical protein
VMISLWDDSSSSSLPSSDSTTTQSSTVDLNATVQFTGTQFVVTNSDSFNWTNCKLEVNPKTFSSGFTYQAALLAAGQTYSVGSLQFANGDGKRFNPFDFKPTSFSVSCDTPSGRGYYYGGWK